MRLPAGSHPAPVLCAAPRILLLPVNVFALFCSQQPGPRRPENKNPLLAWGEKRTAVPPILFLMPGITAGPRQSLLYLFNPAAPGRCSGAFRSAGSQLSPLSARLPAPYSSHSSSFEYLMLLLSITKNFRLSRELFFFPINFPISTKIAFCLDNACKAVIIISRRKGKQSA